MFKFATPFRMLIAGSSGSGKSTLVGDIINNHEKLFTIPMDKIVYCAKYETSIPIALRDNPLLFFHEGIPTEEMIRNDERKYVLFVLDDLLEIAFSSDIVSTIYTQGRNRLLSAILISQNLFPQFSKARNISLNANYIIIFRNLRDSSSINHLARQVCPNNAKAFSDLFINNINKPFSYLLLDFSVNSPDIFRFRENILSDQPIVYINDVELERCGCKFEKNSEIPAFAVEFQEF